MADIARQAKEAFPANIFIALVVGLLMGYTLATYVGGSSGLATQTCGSHTRWCAASGTCLSDNDGANGGLAGSTWDTEVHAGGCKSSTNTKGESK